MVAEGREALELPAGGAQEAGLILAGRRPLVEEDAGAGAASALGGHAVLVPWAVVEGLAQLPAGDFPLVLAWPDAERLHGAGEPAQVRAVEACGGGSTAGEFAGTQGMVDGGQPTLAGVEDQIVLTALGERDVDLLFAEPDDGLHEGASAAEVLSSPVLAELAGEDAGLLVGPRDRVVLQTLATARRRVVPGVAAGDKPPDPALDLDEEEPGAGEHQRVHLQMPAAAVDELEVGPGRTRLVLRKPRLQPRERPALVRVGGSRDLVPGKHGEPVTGSAREERPTNPARPR